jgi:Holliday junction resolvase RusA-like endonuclease
MLYLLVEMFKEAAMADIFFSGRLPLPPGINQSYKIVTIRPRGKKPFNRLGDTPAAAAFKKAAAMQLKDTTTTQVDWQVVETIREALGKGKHIPLEMKVTFYFKTMWKRDVDGGEKHAVDAVCKHLGLNDNLVTYLPVKKKADRNDQRVEVSLCIAEE